MMSIYSLLNQKSTCIAIYLLVAEKDNYSLLKTQIPKPALGI